MVNKKQSKALRHELLPKLRSLVEGSTHFRESCRELKSYLHIFSELDVEYKMSDDLLLCFLRVRKCDVDRAFKSVSTHVLYLMFLNRAPSFIDFISILDQKLYLYGRKLSKSVQEFMAGKRATLSPPSPPLRLAHSRATRPPSTRFEHRYG